MGTKNCEQARKDEAEALTATAVARRRVLLKGVGKGAAVLAAAVPIQTLATQSLLTFDGQHQCSISGAHSGVHSATPSGAPRCGGYSIKHWGQADSTGNLPLNAWPAGVNPSGKFNSVFTLSGLPVNVSLFDVVNLGIYSNTANAHWVCAWLNALNNSSGNFPYTAQQVLDYYNLGPGSTVYQDALAFFTNFMETHP